MSTSTTMIIVAFDSEDRPSGRKDFMGYARNNAQAESLIQTAKRSPYFNYDHIETHDFHSNKVLLTIYRSKGQEWQS